VKKEEKERDESEFNIRGISSSLRHLWIIPSLSLCHTH